MSCAITRTCCWQLRILCPTQVVCLTRTGRLAATAWTTRSSRLLARPTVAFPWTQLVFMAASVDAVAKQAVPADSVLPSGTSFRKKVEILNERNERLIGYLDDTGSENVVILCHGFRSSKDSGTLGIVASALLEAGITVFRFDFSGNGESEGEFVIGNSWDEVEDLRAVVLHWRSEGRKVSHIVGHSKGGCAVLLYASKYQDVGTVINVSGRCYGKNGVRVRLGEEGIQKLEEKGFLEVNDRFGSYRVTRKSLEPRYAETDMQEEAAKIPPSCSVFTIHGSDDDVVLVKDAYEFDKVIPTHSLNIIQGGDHRFRSKAGELGQAVVAYVQGKADS